MLKRTLAVLLLLVLMVPAALAQEPTDLINTALADLSARLGTTVTRSNLLEWRWSAQFYPDTSLGCPAAGQTYPQERTLAYQFLFTVRSGATYDYRANTDGSILFLCVDGRPAEGAPGAAPTSTPAPPQPPTPALTPTLGTPAACDPVAGSGYLPTRFAAGMEGRTADPTVPSNVRAQPSRGSNVLFQIPGGERFSVLAGPFCAENLVWWQVEYTNRVGYAAEGEGEMYWLEPLPGGREAVAAANAGALNQLAVLQHAASLSGNVVFSPDGSRLASGTEDGAVYLWETATGLQKFALTGHAGAITALAFSADGAVLASGDAEGVVRLWNAALGQEQFALTGHESAVSRLAFSKDGSLLASGSTDGIVRLWDVTTGLGLSLITAHTGAVIDVTFTADGTLLATSSADGSVRLWGLPSR